MFITRYLKDGLLERKRPKVGHIKLVPETIEYIISPETLKNWRHMTMHQRCDMLFHDRKVRISRTLLLTVYRENDIVRRKPSFKFNRRLRSPFQHTNEKINFLTKLLYRIRSDR